MVEICSTYIIIVMWTQKQPIAHKIQHKNYLQKKCKHVFEIGNENYHKTKNSNKRKENGSCLYI